MTKTIDDSLKNTQDKKVEDTPTLPLVDNEKPEDKTEGLFFSNGNLVLSQYKIIREIGRGGMNSVIYLAEDITINTVDYFEKQNKYVAIKVVNKNSSITDDQWLKFGDECVTSSRVTNLANIVKTYQVERINEDKTIIIVMEYIDGISLREHLNTHVYLSVRESLYLFEKILTAIKELHNFQQKIIHRDLKPENILLTKDMRQLKVIDFGISSVISIGNDKNEICTNEKELYGTYPYISPDIYNIKNVSNDAKAKLITEQFDFYSLGVILYEMLTGKKPFIADNYSSASVINLPLTYDLPIMSDINPNITPIIENIIFKCMASKPEDIKYRYHSVQEIINDVNIALNGSLDQINQKLIKPRNLRAFQNQNFFNIERQKLHEKFYEKWWFFILIASCSAVILLVTICIKFFF